jgi:hypothetical protein
MNNKHINTFEQHSSEFDDSTFNENDDSFIKLTKMKEIYDDLIKNYVSQYDASKELMRHSTGGYEMGEYGYPVVYFSGDYCLVLGSGIYKKIN